MVSSLAPILDDAGQWLEGQLAGVNNAQEEQALSRFRKFLESLSQDDAPPKLEAACWLISRWTVDQCDWNGPVFARISAYVQQVHQYSKDEAWRRHKLGIVS